MIWTIGRWRVAIAVLLAAQLCVIDAPAQQGLGDNAAAPIDARGRALLASFTDDISALSADFRQTLYDRDGSIKEVSSGYTRIARPDRFLWVYSEPYEQRIIADGVNLWLYDVDLDQVTVKPQREALGRSPAEILGGDAQALAAFDYQGAFERDGILWVQLQPRENDTDFEGMRLGFAAEQLASMELADSLGQVTRIDFTRVTLDAPMPDATFHFEPPEGVDVIGTVSGPAIEGLGALQ
jgi:outer membrane lipoprotein carrier protein